MQKSSVNKVIIVGKDFQGSKVCYAIDGSTGIIIELSNDGFY